MKSNKISNLNQEELKKCPSKATYISPCLTVIYDVEKITYGGDPHIPLESQGTFS